MLRTSSTRTGKWSSETRDFKTKVLVVRPCAWCFQCWPHIRGARPGNQISWSFPVYTAPSNPDGIKLQSQKGQRNCEGAITRRQRRNQISRQISLRDFETETGTGESEWLKTSKAKELIEETARVNPKSWSSCLVTLWWRSSRKWAPWPGPYSSDEACSRSSILFFQHKSRMRWKLTVSRQYHGKCVRKAIVALPNLGKSISSEEDVMLLLELMSSEFKHTYLPNKTEDLRCSRSV